jgi:predicted nucleotidyltransferase
VKIHKDLKEFIELLNSNAVEYVVVGGHAVAYHGYPRFTGDLDFFVRPSQENASRVVTVLKLVGFTDADDLKTLLTVPGKVVQLGRPPNRIDILSGVSGITFEQALGSSEIAELDGLPVRMIGFDALIENKTASGRPKDRMDVDQLTKTRRKGK